MRLLFGLVFFFGLTLYTAAQTNSTPYKNMSLIKIHSSNQELLDSLLNFNIVPISCRGGLLESELIVDSVTLHWLNKNRIPFSILHQNVEEMIDFEMHKITSLKNKRSSNLFLVPDLAPTILFNVS